MGAYETKIYTAVIIASFIVGVIIAIFFISLIRHQKKLLEFHRRNILSEITTLENERSRIAADLHDELAPLLYLVKYQVSALDIQNTEDSQLQLKSVAVIESISERIRCISRDLLPSALTRKGIITALEEYISDLNQSSNLKVAFTHKVSSQFPPAISVNVFRILQEMIQNTVKHAKASKLLIDMKEENDRLNVLCEDNGKGFDHTRHLEENVGLGLRNINSRIEILRGEVSVMSEPGKGTQYVFKIPITN